MLSGGAFAFRELSQKQLSTLLSSGEEMIDFVAIR